VGGGPSGIATALASIESGHTVLVVERSLYEEARVGETISPDILPVLTRLGLWEGFSQAGHIPSAGIRSFWGSASPLEQSFVFNPYGTGWHVDRRSFDAFIARMARERGVRLALGSRLQACEPDIKHGWRLRLDSPDSVFDVRARYVVDATGRGATLARRLGATRTFYDQLIGVTGFFKQADAGAQAGPFTLIEAAENGWWYSAPLPGDRLVVAFMTDADLYEPADKRDASYWRGLMKCGAPHTFERTAMFTLDGRLRVIGANSSSLEPMCGPGWLAVGDAAAACDPLSGDGVHRSLVAGSSAAAAILADEKGDGVALLKYAVQSKEEFETYLRIRQKYYRSESRWPGSLFWERRRKDNGPLSEGMR
jgi:flavin-dependent dehydrogenase